MGRHRARVPFGGIARRADVREQCVAPRLDPVKKGECRNCGGVTINYSDGIHTFAPISQNPKYTMWTNFKKEFFWAAFEGTKFSEIHGGTKTH